MLLRSRSCCGCLVVLAVWMGACSDQPNAPDPTDSLQCTGIDLSFLADGGVGRDGIPALSDPPFVSVAPQPDNSYISDDDRVVGIELDGAWYAIPHNVLWRHEIVNLDVGNTSVAVTYCPLTGSALAFDRSTIGNATLGVSGLLYQANLIMYDRNAPDESLWPQMLGEARCGSRTGAVLTRLPTLEMTWEGWRRLFPGSEVVAIPENANFQYLESPYGAAYELPGNSDFLGFPQPAFDTRREPKERVLGLSGSGGSLAFPLGALAELGARAAVSFEWEGRSAVVFSDDSRESATAYWSDTHEFEVVGNEIRDVATGSTWEVHGSATTGALEGTRLEAIDVAYVAFWASWAAFHPGTVLGVE